jgi:hypothetical protein
LKRSSIFPLAMAATPIIATILNLTPFSFAQQFSASTLATGPKYREPTNLQVLPKNLTGAQVRDIMAGWANDLGAECSTCHTRNPNDTGPNGRPRFNYADDSKEEKKTARVMYNMVDSINMNFVAKVPNSGIPVSCGTCHRGHLSPEPYNGDEQQKR